MARIKSIIIRNPHETKNENNYLPKRRLPARISVHLESSIINGSYDVLDKVL